MLTTNKIRNYLLTTNNEENLSLRKHLYTLATQLDANIILANKYGGIVYDINYQSVYNIPDKLCESIPIFCKGEMWGMLVVIKKSFTPLERILLEMEVCLISIYLH
ncbi:MAG: hypothetical protein MJ050_07025 [Phascolarctobacterium sp.]|nr:hypothetical protein [Phascolarctobacterium sp.]